MVQRIYLGVVGALFVASGIFAFIDPHTMGQSLGIAPVDLSGETEIRATYGGLTAGIGLLLLSGIWFRKLAFAGLAVMVFGVGGLVLTRLFGEVFSGGPGIAANQGFAIAFESVAVAIACIFLLRAPR